VEYRRLSVGEPQFPFAELGQGWKSLLSGRLFKDPEIVYGGPGGICTLDHSPRESDGLVLQVKSFSLRVCCSTWLSCSTRPVCVRFTGPRTRRRLGRGRISNKGYRF